ncbi:MAG: hypothetical protein PHG00_17810, partial [Methylococcales bacterium]|nr:hypothetical protein [Methylococcales bacterium]
LAAGASVTIGSDGGPYTVPNGTHTITAYADDVNRFAESNETNNKLSQSVTVGGISTATTSNPFFGFSGHFWGPYYNNAAATIGIVQQSGGGLYRVDLRTGQYALTDQLLAAAEPKGIKLIAILEGPDASYASSYNEAKAFATKYAGRIQYYQLSNEGDNVTGVQGDGARTTDYDTALYNGIKTKIQGLLDGVRAGDPNAKTIVNFTWLHYGFIQRLINDGIKFDIVGLDWYWEDVAKVHGTFNLSSYIKTQFNKPLFVMEGNKWAGSDGGVEAAQATYISQTATAMCNNPDVSAYIVYEMLDEPGAGGFEAHMGLMYNTTSPKPAFNAYKQAITGCQR